MSDSISSVSVCLCAVGRAVELHNKRPQKQSSQAPFNIPEHSEPGRGRPSLSSEGSDPAHTPCVITSPPPNAPDPDTGEHCLVTVAPALPFSLLFCPFLLSRFVCLCLLITHYSASYFYYHLLFSFTYLKNPHCIR